MHFILVAQEEDPQHRKTGQICQELSRMCCPAQLRAGIKICLCTLLWESVLH